ncbi:hypothetical protein AWB64_06197 [Caballeronia sordidicola]|uniref:Uncharacterized protein n=1 Tax=Caballeronia sordidicola TaxID=196367 RepID=A0A158IHA1_CABSO|nr:hypothetical protein AWB64_06197 [Caballeronia sordidicola]
MAIIRNPSLSKNVLLVTERSHKLSGEAPCGASSNTMPLDIVTRTGFHIAREVDRKMHTISSNTDVHLDVLHTKTAVGE